MTSDPHESTEEIAYLSVDAIRTRLADGSLTATQLVSTLLERIEALDSPASPIALRSILALSPDAHEQAAASDQRRSTGHALGPLDGIPVLIKDNIEARGLPACAGSTALRGSPPARDAHLVARLRSAGAIVLGSTNLSEWANIRSSSSTGGWSAVGGLCGNPWGLDRNAGGSSSGAGAALAAGLAPLCVGTETDGSIVCPASLNGVTGLKPTVGAVPTEGVIPISASQDSPGPMARSVRDLALLFEVLADQRGVADQVDHGHDGSVLAIARSFRTGHGPTDELFDAACMALAEAGLALTDRDPPEPSSAEDDEETVLFCELFDDLSRYLAARPGAHPMNLEALIDFEDRHADVELAHFGHDLFVLAVATGGRANEQYEPARRRALAWALTRCLEPAIEGAVALMAPSFGPAWKSDLAIGGHPAFASHLTAAAAIAGWPILALPLGLVSGLPVGLALVGRPGAEADLLRMGAAIEAVLALDVENSWRPSWEPIQRG